MDIIKVNLKEKAYNIEIGKGFFQTIDFQKFGASKYGIITDSNIRRLYGEKLQQFIQNQGLNVELFDFPAGEGSKNLSQAEKLGRELIKKEFDRDSTIIALGGGVVGDLTGFVASFYKRGIDYIQIPTSLLAQVDSSIGGKTGVDIAEGKNLFGAFHQPKAVFIDTNFLKSLPEEEIKNGLAEVIKYGMIQDAELFGYLEQNHLNRGDEFYLWIIKRSCAIKAQIVEEDEKEKEFRKVLNYGHTIGHPIEAIQGHGGKSHGQAVALGMVYEGKIANKLGLLSEKDLNRQNQLIQAIGLPVNYEGNSDELIEIMKRDKKVKSGEIYFVLPTKIGEAKQENGQVTFPVNISLIRECISGEV